MDLNQVGDLLQDTCVNYPDALRSARDLLPRVGSGSHSTVFDVEGGYVVKISENSAAFEWPDLSDHLHLEFHLIPYFNVTHCNGFTFAFQEKGELPPSDKESITEYERIINILDAGDVLSPSWQFGDWADYNITLDLTWGNVGLFDGKMKFFDY